MSDAFSFDAHRNELLSELEEQFEALIAEMQAAEESGDEQRASQLESQIMEILSQVRQITQGILDGDTEEADDEQLA